MEVPRDDLDAELRKTLEALREEARLRSLALPDGIDFSSNDYLGLAAHPDFRRRLLEALSDAADSPLSAPASRLLRGHTSLHDALEERLAQYKGTESALVFASGYQANLALITSLVGPQDRVLSDELNHASLIDGIRLSRAQKVIFPHCDGDAVARALATSHRQGRTFLITESLFSMEGDAAPLAEYADLTERYDASLIVDDAHATGIYGESRGSGLTELQGVERRSAAIVTTFGKALGCGGAMICGSRILRDYLINTARPFIFSTAVSPLLLHAIGIALDLAAAEPWRRARVLRLAARLRERLAEGGLGCGTADSPIVPIVLGSNERASSTAAALREQGFDVRAVRPPTVPAGTARLRISIHADHDAETIDSLANVLLAMASRSIA